MSTVRSLLDDIKQSGVFNIAPDSTVFDAIKSMQDNEVGALLVMEGDEFVGIVTERDYTWKVELEERTAKNTLVNQIMTPDSAEFSKVSPFTSLEECLALMDEHKIRHLPVMEDGKVVGIISIRDVVHGFVLHQTFLAQQFLEWMSGSN